MDGAFFWGCHLMLKRHPLLIVFVPISSRFFFSCLSISMHISASAPCLLYIKEAGCGIDRWERFSVFPDRRNYLPGIIQLTKQEAK